MTAVHEIPIWEVPLGELLSIWAELATAHADANPYGGDTAEIYAYRLSGRDPTAEQDMGPARANQNERAGRALVAICRAFQDEYGCTITIDGANPVAWRGREFDHRVHVTVFP